MAQQPDQSMRDAFRGYYRPSPARTKAIWKSALVVLDTNVLLDLYRYSAATRDALLDVMSRLQEQLWLPHQVAKEFQERRLGVVRQQDDVAQKLKGAVAQAHKTLRNRCNELAEHPYLERAPLLDAIEKGFTLMTEEVSKRGGKSDAWDPIEDDEIRSKFDELFARRVGPGFTSDELRAVIEQGEKRYADELPPGFRDADKKGDRKYGDLILWLQIVAKAADVEKPVILVTSDGKEDWWWTHGSGRVGPHPKLVEELHERAGTELLMYTPERFTKHASRLLKTDVSKQTLDEIATVADRPAEEAPPKLEHLDTELLIRVAREQAFRLRQKMNGHVGHRASLRKRLTAPLTAEEVNETQRAINEQERLIEALRLEVAFLEKLASVLESEPEGSRHLRFAQRRLLRRVLRAQPTDLIETPEDLFGWFLRGEDEGS